jgi:[acyl-carrier-protein] S-malonyltransferase
MPAIANPLTYLCPGQGAQSPTMMTMIKQSERAMKLLPLALDAIDTDLASIHIEDEAFLRRNEVSAMLVCLSTIAAHEKLMHLPSPQFYMGYSVGQWVAMHLAGMLTAETLIEVIAKRCQFMNATLAVKQGGMLAVIGLAQHKVEQTLAGIDGYVIIANDNAPGQYTLAGEHAALDQAEKQLAELKPQKMQRVLVAGAWHSAMVEEAVTPFLDYLSTVTLSSPTTPVINNVTGKPLPKAPQALRETLAAHLASPVRWVDGMRFLMAQGVQTFIEVGYGNTLSKFGFFIDRSHQHIPWDNVIV